MVRSRLIPHAVLALLGAVILIAAASATAAASPFTLGEIARLDSHEDRFNYWPAVDTDEGRTFATWRESETIHWAELDAAGGTVARAGDFERRHLGRVSAGQEPAVAVDGDRVHLAWVETGDAHSRIVVASSADAGRNWAVADATPRTQEWIDQVGVAADGDRVYVTYKHSSPRNGDTIRTAGSRDGGRTWPCQARVSRFTDHPDRPSVAVTGAIVHFSYREDRRDAVYRRSTDDGRTFQPAVVLGTSVGNVQLRTDGKRVLVVHGKGISVSSSGDGGASFSTAAPLAPGERECQDECFDPVGVDLDGDLAVVAWNGLGTARAARSTNGGASFSPGQELGPAVYTWHASYQPTVAVDGEAVSVAWHTAPRPSTVAAPDYDLDPMIASSRDGGATYRTIDADADDPGQAIFPAALAHGGPDFATGAAWWRVAQGLYSPRQNRFRSVALTPADVELLEATPTQGAEDAQKLVAGRPAAVRVKLHSAVPRPITVPVRVTATYQSASGPATKTAERSLTLRGGRPSTAYLRIPGVPVAGTLHVHAEIDPDHETPDADPGNDVVDEERPVVAVKPLRVLFVPVHASDEDPTPCGRVEAVADGTERYLEAAWPVDLRTSRFDVDCSNPFETQPGLDGAGFARLYAQLDTMTWLDDYDRVIGVVPDGWFARQGVEGSKQSAGQAPYDSLLGSAVVDARARGGWVSAHELAHELGWVSPDAGEHGHLDRVPARGFWVENDFALPGGTLDAMHPVGSLDEMRSETARWTSQATWDFLVGKLAAGQSLAAAATQVLSVSGTLAASGATATLGSVTTGEGTPDPADPDGDLVLQQLDAGGAVLSSTPFSAGRVYGSLAIGDPGGAEPPHVPAGEAPFSIRAPLVTGAVKLRVRKGTTTLAERTRSANAPAVSVTAPTAGKRVRVGSLLEIKWTATDADGGTLRSTVQVSADGTRWTPVAVDVAGTTLTITAPASMAGDTARVRVTTTDGWRSTAAQSAAFNVNGGLSDGKLVLMDSLTGGIYTAPSDGSGPETKITTGSSDRYPRWSPDGSRIAYGGSYQQSDGSFQTAIFTAAADGTAKRRVTNDVGHWPRWTGPHTVSYSWYDRGDYAGIRLVEDDESRTTRTWPIYGTPCDLSADGTRITLRTGEEITIADPDGTHAVKIPGARQQYTANTTECPSFSPDMSKVVGVDYGDIAVWDVATGKETLLTHDDQGKPGGADHQSPEWSPTGEWIYWCSSLARPGSYDVWRMRPDGTGKERVLDGDRNHDGQTGSGDARWYTVDVQPLMAGDDGDAAPQPPVAKAGGPYAGTEGAPVALDATGSKPGADGGASIASYAWDLDGDGAYDDADGAKAQARFADDGTFPVGVRVTDQAGRASTAVVPVTVANAAPKVTQAAVAPAPDGRLALGAAIEDAGEEDTHTATVDWGDGQGPRPATVLTGGATPRVLASHAPIAAGTTVKIAVTDDDGGKGQGTAAVSPAPLNRPPTLDGDTVRTGYGEPVELPLRASDPDGDRLVPFVVGKPEHGRLIETDGPAGTTFAYVPDDGFSGEDRAVLRVADGSQSSGDATVAITVGAPPADATEPDAVVAQGPGGVDPAASPAPTPRPRPADPDDGPDRAPGTVPDAAVKPADTVTLPNARRCASRRRFPIHIRRPKGVAPYRAVQVKVDGKVVRSIRDARKVSRATVDLRGLPKGRFTVAIRVTLASGRAVTTKRRYRTCTARRTKPTRSSHRRTK